MRVLFFSFFVLFIVSCYSSSKDNNNTNAFTGKEEFIPTVFLDLIQIDLPNDFVKMDSIELNKLYPQANRRPDVIYKRAADNVNLTFHYTTKKVSSSEIPSVLEQLTSNYRNNSTVKILESYLIKINNNDFAVLEFISRGKNYKHYNRLQITSVNERLVMLSFSCILEAKTKWKNKADYMFNSFLIK